jgi:hypothetical protein
MASARTGPPWPRNWACAVFAPIANSTITTQKCLVIGGLHAERNDTLACHWLA